MNRLSAGLMLGDRYQLDRHLASGGMGDVWIAHDHVLLRRVAIKVMRASAEHHELFAIRFREEAQHSARLLHTNIATTFDYGEDTGLSFLVMELVDGHPLSHVIRAAGPLPADHVRSVLGQCALALGVAHAAHLVHRDVKPANILVREDGLVKLTDFGIARAADAAGQTGWGDIIGTPSYISPEQARGAPATGASDLYALGVVGHEMLTGTKAFNKPTPVSTAWSHVHEPPPRLPDDVPEVLAGVIEDLLAKEPADRPINARAVAIRLGLADHELMGLALGLAQAVYGEPSPAAPALERGPSITAPSATLAVDPATLLGEAGRSA